MRLTDTNNRNPNKINNEKNIQLKRKSAISIYSISKLPRQLPSLSLFPCIKISVFFTYFFLLQTLFPIFSLLCSHSFNSQNLYIFFQVHNLSISPSLPFFLLRISFFPCFKISGCLTNKLPVKYLLPRVKSRTFVCSL